ncbi:ylmG homolog protein 1-2, chloroplastic [Ziziphus jujuba]|uniref:YlmG homolog protein 1-2, chloroplastic n=1 Tax=Ziziphus jujuba TaxID=326968 RepID=A0A6P4AMM0_ZIZJJ|nr:ylmG homolog protein 1-2, chloroplastic [Ziziphus jujuba]
MASTSVSPMASQALLLTNPNPTKPILFHSHSLSLPHSPNLHLNLKTSSFNLRPNAKPNRNPRGVFTVSASSTTATTTTTTAQSPLTGSTRTVTTILSLALLVLRKLPHTIFNSVSPILGPAVWSSAGPLFFAALRDRPSGYLNTPLTVVAAGLAKWLDIYSGVLMVRVLLSWFPNIPWDRQPLSAIRDLCDPYLNLFRNIIPPIFDTLDVSPLLAFAVLGTLGSILNSSRGMY